MGRRHWMLKRKPRTVFALQEVLKRRRQLVTESLQCLFQLVAVDGVVLVFVEMTEYALPALCRHCKNAYATARQQTEHIP